MLLNPASRNRVPSGPRFRGEDYTSLIAAYPDRRAAADRLQALLAEHHIKLSPFVSRLLPQIVLTLPNPDRRIRQGGRGPIDDAAYLAPLRKALQALGGIEESTANPSAKNVWRLPLPGTQGKISLFPVEIVLDRFISPV